MLLRHSHLVASATLWIVCAPLLSAQTPMPVPPANRTALLIGIDTYQPKGLPIRRPANVEPVGRFAADLVFDNLKGPQNDVKAMRALLTSAKFAFPDDDQHIHTLLDTAATRQAILDALGKYVAGAKPGDEVVLYISSHGSLRVNDAGDGQLYQLEDKKHKLDNTVVPADAYLGAEDITSRELRDVFQKASDRGVHLTAIFDTCHSGGQARGIDDKTMVKRSLSWDPRDLNQPTLKAADGSPAPAPQDSKTNPVLILSASQKDQSAIDVQSGTPHGLFTSALVQALEALPAGAPASDVYKRVMVDMELEGAANQQPALDSTPARKAQPLFGGAAENGPLRATVVSIDDSKELVLDVGKIADVGTGSEFTQLNPRNGVKAVIRVDGALGIERSTAVLVSPASGKVQARDIFELTKKVLPQRPEVLFYAGPANLSTAQIQEALAAVRASSVELVNDPSADPWTHLLTWDGLHWILQGHSIVNGLTKSARPSVTALGATLTAASLKKTIPAGSILWFDAPLPSESAAMPALADEQSAARLTADRQKALYVLASSVSEDGIGYAWYKRGDFDADVQTPKGYGRGCAPDSPYPLRTAWVAAPDALQRAAGKLAKLNSWLTLQSSATDSNPFGYTLGLQRVADKQSPGEGGVTAKDDRYSLTLNGSTDYVGPSRWVYVLAIDCQGTGALLWPNNGPGGKFPTDNGRLASIPLPGLTFRITPPFGTDTYVLLTTSTALPEPDKLNFEGVVRAGERGLPATGLQGLLESASSGSRGAEAVAPTDWGVQLLQMHSTPSPANK